MICFSKLLILGVKISIQFFCGIFVAFGWIGIIFLAIKFSCWWLLLFLLYPPVVAIFALISVD